MAEIERSNQTIECDVRTAIHGILFKGYPPIMIKELVEHYVNLRYKFPNKNGVSDTLGPLSLIIEATQPKFSDFSLQF